MVEFIIVVMTISVLTGSWMVAPEQPYTARAYDTASSCEEAVHGLSPLPGDRLVCMPREPLSLFEPLQVRPPFAPQP
jgi:hypothetical protein